MNFAPDAASDARQIGPSDREAFSKAQKRNRTATLRVSVLCFVAAIVMGIPLTLVLTPLFYAITVVLAEIINSFLPLPPAFWAGVNNLSHLIFNVADHFINNRGTLDQRSLLEGLALMLAPGMVLSLMLWLGMRGLFRRGGVGGTLTTLNAREPNSGDLKELQLVSAVEEIATAAGLPSPHVVLADTTGANAAAFGASPQDAHIVVSRRLLDDLERDELDALLAHLVGSIGNGDMRIAFTLTSIFESCGLLVALIDSPFSRQSRGTLWRVFRYGLLRSSSNTARATEAESVAALLTGSLDTGSHDIDRFFEQLQSKRSLLRGLLSIIFLPVFFTNAAVEITLWFFFAVLLGPCVALLWRTRRYLADASAVALTHNPDALARALKRLNLEDKAIPGGIWASHFFVVDPEADSGSHALQSGPEAMKAAARAWKESAGTVTSSGIPMDYNRMRDEIEVTRRAAMRGDTEAIGRLVTFGRSMAMARGGQVTINIPDVADIAAARQGDKSAIARLRILNALESEVQRDESKHGTSGLRRQSFLSFHPPLKRRLKCLEHIGAPSTPTSSPQPHAEKSKIAVTIVRWLGMAPLLLGAAAVMLVVIATITAFDLIFVGLWLAAIHWIFLGHAA